MKRKPDYSKIRLNSTIVVQAIFHTALGTTCYSVLKCIFVAFVARFVFSVYAVFVGI